MSDLDVHQGPHAILSIQIIHVSLFIYNVCKLLIIVTVTAFNRNTLFANFLAKSRFLCLNRKSCPNQVLKAQKARKFMHNMSAPSYKDLRKVIRMNHIKNCPVSIEDIGLAERIFGKDVPVLKGKTVRPKSKEVNKDLYQPFTDYCKVPT